LAKKRIIKDYHALPEEIIRQVKMAYPTGFVAHLVQYTNQEGKIVSALPFETEDTYYLIRMTAQEARRIVSEDEDYDEEGVLREGFADIDVDTEFEGVAEEEEQEDDYGDDLDEDSHHIIPTRRRRGDDDEEDDIADDSDEY
jgi:Ran GTPase-activating protein (RanGAP) involved in mRNA processing and transport